MQGSQTRGPRAANGPLKMYMQPETLIQTDKIRNFNHLIIKMFKYEKGNKFNIFSKFRAIEPFLLQTAAALRDFIASNALLWIFAALEPCLTNNENRKYKNQIHQWF